jgi:hypothetical protein
MHDAVVAGASLVAQADGFPLVVVLTDAAETRAGWMRAQRRTHCPGRVIVDVVWSKTTHWSDDVDVTFGPSAPDSYAKPTGGVIFDSTAQDLRQQLWQRVQEIRASYVLTYAPADALRDGWHDLKVKLKNRKGESGPALGSFSGPAVMRRR